MTFRSRNDASFFATRSLFTLVLIFIFAAATTGCGGGGNGTSAPQPQLTITGHAINDAVANGTVRLETLDGRVLGQTRTDGEGAFAIETSETEIAEGYQLVVTGGQVRGRSFRGELRARYLATEDHSAANVTLLTTLVGRMAGLQASGTPMQRRESALRRMNDLGAFEPGQWNAIEPEGVALEYLRVAVVEQGFDDLLETLASQLHVGEFHEDLLEFFPGMFGGVVSLAFGDERNRISDFSGSSGVVEVQPITTTNENYGFALEAGPGWVAVNPSTGTITYDIPDGAESGHLAPFSIRVTNSQTGLGRSIPAAVFVMEAETLVDGSVGPAGGTVMDAWGEVVVEVEPGAALVPTHFRILRGRDAGGDVVLSVRVDGDPDVQYRLWLPDPEVMDANTPAGVEPSSLEPQAFDTARALAPMGMVQASSLSYPITTELQSGWAWFYRGPWTTCERRLPPGNEVSLLGDSDLSTRKVFRLWGPSSYDRNDPTDPVLFVHGYMFDVACNQKMSGGTGTWKNFPALFAGVSSSGARYTPYEFRWSSDGRLQDLATDLAAAIVAIEEQTGRRIHIVAHSYGGLLTRTLLQGLASSDAASFASPLVASVTTVGTPHSGIYPFFGGTRGGITFPNGRDSGVLWSCDQISCYQMGVSPTVPWTNPQRSRLGLDANKGFMAQRLVETVEQLPNVPIQVLIGLTAHWSGSTLTWPSKAIYKADDGDELISFEGQRFLPHLGTTSGWLNANFGGAQVRERLLGYDERQPQIVPGSLVAGREDRWLNEDYKKGYRHTKDLLRRGSAKQVAIGCSSVVGCEHDVWLKTRDFVAGIPAGAAAPPTITLGGAVRDATGQGIPGVSVIFSAGGTRLPGFAMTDASGNYSARLLFRSNTLYEAIALPPGGSNYRAANAASALSTGSSIEGSETSFPPITLIANDAGPGALTVEILDAFTGKLVSGANYFITNSVGRRVAWGTTSEEPVTIPSLPAGSYNVSVSAPGYQTGVYENCLVTGAPVSICSLDLPKEPLVVPDNYLTIQSAIDAASDGDEVLVKPGIYTERISFNGKSIRVRSQTPEDPDIVASTIIHGGGHAPVVSFDGGETSDAVLWGFTITGGDAGRGNAGGVLVDSSSSPVIRGNIIRENRAAYGAGMMITGESSPVIEENAFINNTATFGRGPGIYAINQSNVSINKNVFRDHVGGDGVIHIRGTDQDRIAQATITGNVLNNNATDFGVGAIKITVYSSAKIEDNIITNNTALGDNHAGGVYIGFNSEAEIVGNTITGNHAESYYSGGGVSVYRHSKAQIVDNIITRNTGKSGGISLNYYVDVLIRGNTISDNSAPDSHGGGIGLRSWGQENNVVISDNVIRTNDAALSGGGIYLPNCPQTTVQMDYNIISGNSSGPRGGGVFVGNIKEARIYGNVFYENEAGYIGGGIFVRDQVFPLGYLGDLWSRENVPPGSEDNNDYSENRHVNNECGGADVYFEEKWYPPECR